MEEPSCHEENWCCEVGTVDEKECPALFVALDLTRVGQVSVPSKHERAGQDNPETAESLDSVENRQVLKRSLLELARAEDLALLVWLHVHLVDVANG